jgi:hypothetical protein
MWSVFKQGLDRLVADRPGYPGGIGFGPMVDITQVQAGHRPAPSTRWPTTSGGRVRALCHSIGQLHQ